MTSTLSQTKFLMMSTGGLDCKKGNFCTITVLQRHWYESILAWQGWTKIDSLKKIDLEFKNEDIWAALTSRGRMIQPWQELFANPFPHTEASISRSSYGEMIERTTTIRRLSTEELLWPLSHILEGYWLRGYCNSVSVGSGPETNF